MAYNDYLRSLSLLKEETIIHLHFGTSVSFTKISFPGNIASRVNETEDNNDLLMVIMRTKGAKNLPEILFGSNASSLSKCIDVPLLVVP